MENNFDSKQQLQLISPNGDIMGGINAYLAKLGLSKIGKAYHFVSIVGCQSTGKSTLLNKLFGTTFSTMDSTIARKQTTRGVLVSKDKEESTFILDIEGSDSKERWEERGPFEQSTALFALVLSHVLMINMFSGEVGRFTASNYGVLQVILEQNLKLFAQVTGAQKKKLIFVLRDFAEGDNINAITQTIKDDIYTIWQEISKPKEFQNAFYDKFFDIEFVTLSHYRFARQAFEAEVAALRRNFVDPTSPNYYFKEVRNGEENIPADALEPFMEKIWSTIRSSKDINLPNQRKMVAQIRCTEILGDIMKEMQQYMDQISANMKNDDYKDFGTDGQALIKRASDRYIEETHDYDKEVVQLVEQDLLSQLSSKLFEQFTNRISNLKKQLLKNIQTKLSEKVDSTNPNNLMKNIREFKEAQLNWFKEMIKNSVVAGQDWNAVAPIEEAESLTSELLNTYKEKQLSFFMKTREAKLKRELDNEISSLFDTLDTNFWKNLEKGAEDIFSKAEKDIHNILTTNFELSSEKVTEILDMIKEETFKNLENDLRNKMTDLNYFLLKKFRNAFSRNENGIPINWKLLSEKQIEERYLQCREQTLELLKMLRVFELKAQNLTESTIRGSGLEEELLTQKEFQNIKARLEDDMELECKDAIRKHNASDAGSIPKWLWVVLIYFMYDDILRWLSNPFLRYPLLMIVSMVIMLFTIGYGHLPKALFSMALNGGKLFFSAKFKKD